MALGKAATLAASMFQRTLQNLEIFKAKEEISE